MKEELRKYRQAQAEYDKAIADYVTVLLPYDKRKDALLLQLEEIRPAMRGDPEVVAAADRRDMAMDIAHEAEIVAGRAVLTYYDEYGFPDGKKSYAVEGCKVSVREPTKREVVNAELMLVAAREDGVYLQVIKSVKPVLNRRNFNNWVDLKSPPGVEVSHDFTVKVEVLSEQDK